MRLRAFPAFIVLSTVLVVRARDATAACGNYPLPTTGAYDSHFTSLDNYVQTWVQSNSVSAATLALTYDKMLVYERGFGFQDSGCTQQILPDAKMRLATDSTPMTRRALQQLITDGQLTATTGVQQYLNGYFSLPPSSDARMQQITVEDIYDNLTCTSDANPIDNVGVGLNLNLGRPATATERIQYLWANPQYPLPPGTGGCTPGSAANNGFSHVSHEIAAQVIAIGYWVAEGRPSFDEPFTDATSVGRWYGNYIANVVGPHVGAALFQAPNGGGAPNEIWYDSGALAPRCPEWNYWACAYDSPATQAPVASAYAIDFYARPGSGTVVSSARDVARFMVSYEWATDNSLLTNSINALSNRMGPGKPWGCCDGGSLPGTTALMGDQQVFFNGQYHFYDWTLLVNRQIDTGASPFDITSLLDNGSGTGVFDTYQPTADLWVDDLIHNRWIDQYAAVQTGQNGSSVIYSSTFPSTAPFFPYTQLPNSDLLWRVQLDANGYDQITPESTSYFMLSNEDDLSSIELLAPDNTKWSEEFTLSPAPDDASWTQILTRWWAGHGLNVQNQTGQVEQSTIQSDWWSADWQLLPQPSGICCTNMTSDLSCPSGSTPCRCNAAGCPAYTP